MARPTPILAALATLLLLGGLAVWLLPPQLDWTRYRARIGAIASAELGRPVRIDGAIRLRLLPRPELAANQVVLLDRGDGVVASAHALRLDVALGPLLAGHVVVRELVLRRPELRLPWPLPRGWRTGPPLHWAPGFHAGIEQGAFQIGGAALTDIDAMLRSDPQSGALTATGALRLLGQRWGFTMRMAAPRPDAATDLTMAIDGLGAMGDSGGRFTGSVADDGRLQGRVEARGPDLSLLLPTPSLPWRADGRLRIGDGMARADGIALRLGASPATGSVALQLTPAPRLDLELRIGQLDLGEWLAVLPRPGALALPIAIDLSAQSARWGDGRLHDLRAALRLERGATRIAAATAILPGGTRLDLQGALDRDAAGLPRLLGSARLAAADLGRTLAWLAPLAPGLIAALPPGALRSADLQGRVSLAADRLAAENLQGRLDGSVLNGSFVLRPGQRPHLDLTVALDRLALDPWLPDAPSGLVEGVRRLTGFDGALALDAGVATWGAATLTAMHVDAEAGATGLALHRLAGTLQGTRCSGSGSLAGDGMVTDGELTCATPDATGWRAEMPPLWQGTAALWRAPAAAALRVAGPLDALALQLRADLGDMRLEAEPLVDLASGSWSGTVTLRHPGAPRLLDLLGYPGAQRWLDSGSLALLAHVAVAPGLLSISDFTLTAAALRARGRLDLITGPGPPFLAGDIDADTLALPLPARAATPLPFGLLRGWRGILRIAADRVLADLSPMLDHSAARLTLREGALRIDDFQAEFAQGQVRGAATLDAAHEPPDLAVTLHLAGASLQHGLAGLPIDIVSGRLTAEADLTASGHSPAALLATLSGHVAGAAQNGAIIGFDLARLTQALRSAEPGQPLRAESAAAAALSGGLSPFAELHLAGRFERGALAADAITLAAPDGAAQGGGTFDIPDALIDLDLQLRPAVPDPPPLGLYLTGPVGHPRRTLALAQIAPWLALHVPPAPGRGAPSQPAAGAATTPGGVRAVPTHATLHSTAPPRPRTGMGH